MRGIVIGLLLSSFGLLQAGCSRNHYRLQADQRVSDIVAGASANPRFQLPGHSISIDPRSRLFDPTNPNFPPMPPDDPDANRLMVRVDGHRGWRGWHRDGDIPDVDFNQYQPYLPYDTDGKLRLDLTGTVELARLHSREYQQQLETLYLAALDVTAERFAFNVQFYGGNTTSYAGIGSIFNGGTRSNLLTTTDNLEVEKMFATGGTLLANVANSIVWQFSGGQTTTNFSLLNFAISQPLLQMAGRPVVLERLTRVERSLLGNVRQYQRYRQGFYLNVSTGTPNSSFLQRSGGIFGGSGLTGFTGLGVNGFGGVGAISGLAVGNLGGGAGTAPQGAGGYLGFLQQQQILRNFHSRNARLRDTWLQLNAAFDAGRLENRYQVDFARQAYYTGQSQLLQATAAYQTTLDQFKTTQLALPPDINLEIHDRIYDLFNLIDPELTRLQDEVGDRLEDLASAQVEQIPAPIDPLIRELPERIQKFMDELEADIRNVDANLPQRRQALIDLTQFPELKDNQFDLRAFTVESMEQKIDDLKRDRSRVMDELSGLARKIQLLTNDNELEPEDLQRAEKELLGRLSGSLLELSLLQARARLHGVAISPIRVTPEIAFQVALVRRADWMNYKSSVVDAWRLIRYNANALRTNFTVNLAGDLGTTGNNPVKFSGTNGQLLASVTLDPPLTRVIQRNDFRQSLIDYQQTRRSAMQYRDEMHRGLRGRLRQVRLDQLNLELRRLAVDVAITQTDIARLKLVEPEKPVVEGRAAAASPTVARDLVDALANLTQTQQDLIFTWGDYQIQRRLLDFDLGTMELDDRGIWIDPGTVTDETLMALYYEWCPNPLGPVQPGNQSGRAELSPGELPPENLQLELPPPNQPDSMPPTPNDPDSMLPPAPN